MNEEVAKYYKLLGLDEENEFAAAESTSVVTPDPLVPSINEDVEKAKVEETVKKGIDTGNLSIDDVYTFNLFGAEIEIPKFEPIETIDEEAISEMDSRYLGADGVDVRGNEEALKKYRRDRRGKENTYDVGGISYTLDQTIYDPSADLDKINWAEIRPGDFIKSGDNRMRIKSFEQIDELQENYKDYTDHKHLYEHPELLAEFQETGLLRSTFDKVAYQTADKLTLGASKNFMEKPALLELLEINAANVNWSDDDSDMKWARFFEGAGETAGGLAQLYGATRLAGAIGFGATASSAIGFGGTGGLNRLLDPELRENLTARDWVVDTGLDTMLGAAFPWLGRVGGPMAAEPNKLKAFGKYLMQTGALTGGMSSSEIIKGMNRYVQDNPDKSYLDAFLAVGEEHVDGGALLHSFAMMAGFHSIGLYSRFAPGKTKGTPGVVKHSGSGDGRPRWSDIEGQWKNMSGQQKAEFLHAEMKLADNIINTKLVYDPATGEYKSPKKKVKTPEQARKVIVDEIERIKKMGSGDISGMKSGGVQLEIQLKSTPTPKTPPVKTPITPIVDNVDKVTVYRGSKGKTTSRELDLDPKKIVTVPGDQGMLLESLHNAATELGNKKVLNLIEGVYNPKTGAIKSWQKADRVIAASIKDLPGFEGKELIQYKNQDIKQKGTEYHDLKDGTFWSESKDLAEIYSKQSRSAKYPKLNKQQDNVLKKAKLIANATPGTQIEGMVKDQLVHKDIVSTYNELGIPKENRNGNTKIDYLNAIVNYIKDPTMGLSIKDVSHNLPKEVIKKLRVSPPNEKGEQMITLTHFGPAPENLEGGMIKPGMPAQSYSRREFETWGTPRAFYYTQPEQKEMGTVVKQSEFEYEVEVPANKIYPFNTDPNGYYNKIPGVSEGAKPTVGDQLRHISELAKKDGYIGMALKWGDGYRMDLFKGVKPKLIGESQPATLLPGETALKGVGVVYIGGDAVGDYQGYRYPEKHVIETGSGWQLSKGGATKLDNLAKKGYDTVAVVVYPKLLEAMKVNKLFQNRLKEKIIEKVGKREFNKLLKDGTKVYNAKPKRNKAKTSPIQEAAKAARVNLTETALEMGEAEFPEVAGTIVGVGKYAGIKKGDDRTVVHPVYEAEVMFDRYVRLPEPINFRDFVEGLQGVYTQAGNKLEIGGAYIKTNGLNFWLNRDKSPVLPMLIEAVKGNTAPLEAEFGSGNKLQMFERPSEIINLHGGFGGVVTPEQLKMVHDALIKPGIYHFNHLPQYIQKLGEHIGINKNNFKNRSNSYNKDPKKNDFEKGFWRKVWAHAKKFWGKYKDHWAIKPVVDYVKDYWKNPKMGASIKNVSPDPLEVDVLKAKSNAKIHIRENQLIELHKKTKGAEGLSKLQIKNLRKKTMGSDTYHLSDVKYEMLKAYENGLNQLLQSPDRPEAVAKQIVITPETERRINLLKDNLTQQGRMNEAEFVKILDDFKVDFPGFLNENTFISEGVGQNILQRMIEQLPIIEMRIAEKLAQQKDGNMLGLEVKKIEIQDSKRAERLKTPQGLPMPNRLLDMYHYTNKLEQLTGLPFGRLWIELDKQLHAITYETNQRLEELGKMDGFMEMHGDPAIDSEIINHIRGLPTFDLTESQIAIVDYTQNWLKEFEEDIRYERFMMWWKTGEKIPDAKIEDLEKGKEILETEGPDALRSYLRGFNFGVREIYEIGERKGVILNMGGEVKASLGDSRLHAREQYEFKEWETTYLERFASYVKQMSKRVKLKPLWDAYGRLFTDNVHQFKDGNVIKDMLERNAREMVGISEKAGPIEQYVIRAYSQAARTIFMDLYKGTRNLMQNPAVNKQLGLTNPAGWSRLFSSKLSKKDWDYFESQVDISGSWWDDVMFANYSKGPIFQDPMNPWMRGLLKAGRITTAPIRAVVRAGNSLSDFINMMGRTHRLNQMMAYKSATVKVKNVLEKMPENHLDWTRADIAKMMKRTYLRDLTITQQKHALNTLLVDGKDAFCRYVGHHYTDKVHFNYERSRRGPGEQGSLSARMMSNLLTFKKGYWQRTGFDLGKAGNKFAWPKDRYSLGWGQFWNSASSLFGLFVVGTAIGHAFMRLTNSRRNPYNPLGVMGDPTFGGLPMGTQQRISKGMQDMQMALTGEDPQARSQAVSRLVVTISALGDMFIPFYESSLHAIEGVTDTDALDKVALRQIRQALNKKWRKIFPAWDKYKPAKQKSLKRDYHNKITKILLGQEDKQTKKASKGRPW
tara:strand:- start:39824 stop:46495 length:6672 start_codon:yes stop_codon:yes gene_type:complete